MKRINSIRQWTQAFNEWITNLARQLFLITNKAFARFHDTSASFRCYNKKYYVSQPLFAWNSVVLPWTKWFARSKDGLKAQKEISPGTSYNSWCSEQRRAESPIRIQPRAAPWGTLKQGICALKEQKEGTHEPFSGSFCAYSAQLVSYWSPRVLPWAVFLLGLCPAIACNCNRQ